MFIRISRLRTPKQDVSMLLLYFHRRDMCSNTINKRVAEMLCFVLTTPAFPAQSSSGGICYLKLGRAARPATGNTTHPRVLSDALDVTTFGCSPRSNATQRYESEQ